MPDYPLILNLPDGHYREIGRVVTRWAVLEWRLRRVAYLLLGIGPKEGRVAVRDPRAVDYVTMIRNLMTARGLKIEFDWKTLNTWLESQGNMRDRLAHGIWLKMPEQTHPVLQLTKGTFELEHGKPAVKAVITPGGVPVEASELRKLADYIDTTTTLIEHLENLIAAALAPSPDKPGAPAP